MDESSDNPFEPKTLFDSWMKSISDTWSNMAQFNLAASKSPGASKTKTKTKTKKDTHRGAEFFESTLNAWQAIARAMSHPESLTASLKGIGAIPEILLKMTEPAFNSVAALHQQWINQVGTVGNRITSLDISQLDREAPNIFNQLYDTEFRKLLNIPQLGLAREHQEKINRFLDRFHGLQSDLAEFLRVLYLPFEKTYTAFQEKTVDLAKKNELPEDFRSYYQVWLKILEGEYMTLFKTPEYLAVLGKTLNAAAAYTKARRDLINDLLHLFSVPSSTDIEGVYRELYELKKRIKSIEKATTTL
jgi:class III poly(R)-hydroxyalkanoic acid synthase PhaE subunit